MEIFNLKRRRRDNLRYWGDGDYLRGWENAVGDVVGGLGWLLQPDVAAVS